MWVSPENDKYYCERHCASCPNDSIPAQLESCSEVSQQRLAEAAESALLAARAEAAVRTRLYLRHIHDNVDTVVASITNRCYRGCRCDAVVLGIESEPPPRLQWVARL